MKKANLFVMVLVGLYLISASVFKIHHLSTEAIVSDGFWESWLFFVIQIPLVLGLGIWLVSGLFRKAGWLLGLLAMLVFIGDTVYKGVTGAESCGCFGSVEVNPWITLTALNIPFFLLLAAFPPRDSKLLPPPWPKAGHFFFVALPTFILLPVIIFFLIHHKVEPVIINLTNGTPQSHSLPSKVKEGTPEPEVNSVKPTDNHLSQIKIQEPSERQEQEEQTTHTPEPIKPAEPVEAVKPDTNQTEIKQAIQPEIEPSDNSQNKQQQPTVEPVELDEEKRAILDSMLSQIDIIDSLQEGLAVLVFYHHTCPTCRDVIPVYSEAIDQLGANEINMAFIAVPPLGPADDSPVPPETLCYTGRLPDLEKGKKWYIGTPLIIVTFDSHIQTVWQLQAPSFDRLMETVFSGQ